jgi:hypothetical protein
VVRLWAATRATGAEIRAGCPHSGASVCRRKRHGTMPMVPDPPAASWGHRKAVVGRRDNSATRPRGCRAAGPEAAVPQALSFLNGAGRSRGQVWPPAMVQRRVACLTMASRPPDWCGSGSPGQSSSVLVGTDMGPHGPQGEWCEWPNTQKRLSYNNTLNHPRPFRDRGGIPNGPIPAECALP